MATAAVAALVVRPSTLAKVTLRNGEATGGKKYVIDRVFAHNLVGVANSSYGIWLCVHPVGMSAVTDDIAARGSSNGIAYSGNSEFDLAATVDNDGWFPYGNAGHAVTVTVPGGQLDVPIEGRIILPPTAGLSVQVVADTTGATFTCGVSWYELSDGLE